MKSFKTGGELSKVWVMKIFIKNFINEILGYVEICYIKNFITNKFHQNFIGLGFVKSPRNFKTREPNQGMMVNVTKWML